MKRWVVRRGDPATVEGILAKMGESGAAVADGRVFVGRRRVAKSSDPVREGDEIKVGTPARPRGDPGGGDSWSGGSDASPGGAAASSVLAEPTILLDAEGLLACIKPAGIPTVPDHAGSAHALVAVVARKAGRRADELRVTSRLDRGVSGVVVFATDERAEARLKRAREEGTYARRYVAIASDAAKLADAGTWDAPIGRAADPRLRAAFGPDAKPSTTRYRVVARASGAALLAVEPVTGRTHQIRVHAAHAGAPLFGDRDYGGPGRVTSAAGRVVSLGRIALHCARVQVPRSEGGEGGEVGGPLVLTAPAPAALSEVWIAMGGAASAFDEAASSTITP